MGGFFGTMLTKFKKEQRVIMTGLVTTIPTIGTFPELHAILLHCSNKHTRVQVST